MLTRMRNGWRLGMASLGLLMDNKKLLVFPLLSSVACGVVLASFILPIVTTTTGQQVFLNESSEAGPGRMLLLFLMYFCCYAAMLFFNSALVGVTMLHLDGKPYKLTDGLRIAWDRLGAIMAWALIAASVGLALKMIEQRSKLVGKIIAMLVGSAWTAMTYFVVPVLLVERAPAHKAIGRSFSLIRQTWGEGLVANWANDVIVGLGAAAGVAVVFLGAMSGEPIVVGVTIALAVAWFGVLFLASMALDGITNAVLYVYARTGESPEGFDNELLTAAFSGTGGIGPAAGEGVPGTIAQPAAAHGGQGAGASGGGLPAMPAADDGPSLAEIRARGASDSEAA